MQFNDAKQLYAAYLHGKLIDGGDHNWCEAQMWETLIYEFECKQNPKIRFWSIFCPIYRDPPPQSRHGRCIAGPKGLNLGVSMRGGCDFSLDPGQWGLYRGLSLTTMSQFRGLTVLPSYDLQNRQICFGDKAVILGQLSISNPPP